MHKISRGAGLRWSLGVGLLALWVSAAGAAPTAASGDTPAYVVRGRATEGRLHAYHQRMDRLRAALVTTLRAQAPNLLPSLEPAPSARFGYGLLPRVIPDAPPSPPRPPQVVWYSWGWSDTLVAEEMKALDGFEAALEQLRTQPAPVPRASAEQLVSTFKALVERRRRLDADIDYNWLWQKSTAENRALFDRLTARLEAERQRQEHAATGAVPDTTPLPGVAPPAFLRMEPTAGGGALWSMPLYTDITDASLVQAFVAAVEGAWQGRLGDALVKLQLVTVTLPPERLRCAAPPCPAPGVGDKIDIVAHANRFPADGVVLTTGAATLRIVAGRAIVLSPHDVTPRTLAHEFGHVLGFPDAYLRGYRDLGPDGFQVMELVPDAADLMSSPGTGSVQWRHLQALRDGREQQRLMGVGLHALYTEQDPARAVRSFQGVLALNPTHYGALFQLAKALEIAGRREEARGAWQRVLEAALLVSDETTAGVARAQLRRGP